MLQFLTMPTPPSLNFKRFTNFIWYAYLVLVEQETDLDITIMIWSNIKQFNSNFGVTILDTTEPETIL